jgi:hypothetical protein
LTNREIVTPESRHCFFLRLGGGHEILEIRSGQWQDTVLGIDMRMVL